MAKIGISFKNNSREQELYNYFSNLEDKSGDIKKILQEWYDKNIKKQPTKDIKNNNREINITDF